MRTAVYATLVSILFAATSATALASPQRTTSGSFLRYRANSARELTETVKRDPSVASRYAKHFGTTNFGIGKYFSDRLTLIRLRKATTTYVYYYNNQVRVSRGRRVMPAGTLVFATEAGEPVLDWRCGNPLRVSLPVRQAIKPDKSFKAKAVAGTLKPVKSVKAGAATVVAEGPPDADKVIEKVLGAPPTELPITAAAIAPPTSTAAATAPIVPVATAPTLPSAAVAAPPIVEVAAVPTVTAVSAAPALAAASRGISWLLPLAAAGGVAVAKSKTTTEKPEEPEPPVVPEPGALIPMITGLGTVCAAIRGRRKRH